jgi:crotonobetainyl-CoA:carnitine CoA-transferase CaiB-like acyl-CoA transferase
MHYRNHHLMEIAPMMEEWMEKQNRDDIYHAAAGRRIPIGPINSARDVMNNSQYKARGFFVEVDHPEAGRRTYPGWPYKMTTTPPRITRPAPLLGEHNESTLNDIPIHTPDPRTSPAGIKDTGEGTETDREFRFPLEGIRILDFCWVWAGPFACKLLADLGAEVIKIEGHIRSDLMRRSHPWPLALPEPLIIPPNQGMRFNFLNQNKKSLSLDLSRPEGKDIAKRLAAVSDVVVDNMRPGAMDKMGLGYEALRRIREDIIVASLSSRGRGGPETDYLGFATIHQGVGGLAYITGYPDDHPSHGSPGDADLMNGTTTAYVVVAALYHRRRTGEGQFIDISQCEAVSSLMGDTFMGYDINGRIPERMGNRHPRYAPHGVFRCWGVDRWLALEIHSDDEFAALAEIINRPDLAADARFFDTASRKENEAELNRIIESWTRWRDRDWMVTELCGAGLAASPSRDWRDLYADVHLQDRGAFVKVDHPEVGELELVGPAWKISGIEKPAVRAPLLGEHNEYVLKELLDLSEREVYDLRSKGVIL